MPPRVRRGIKFGVPLIRMLRFPNRIFYVGRVTLRGTSRQPNGRASLLRGFRKSRKVEPYHNERGRDVPLVVFDD